MAEHNKNHEKFITCDSCGAKYLNKTSLKNHYIKEHMKCSTTAGT
jgi:ribosomal protein S26